MENVFRCVSYSANPPPLSKHTQLPTAAHGACSTGPGPSRPSLPRPPFSSLCSGHTDLPAVSWAARSLAPTVRFPGFCLFLILILPRTSRLQRPVTAPPSTPASLSGFYFHPVLTTTGSYSTCLFPVGDSVAPTGISARWWQRAPLNFAPCRVPKAETEPGM